MITRTALALGFFSLLSLARAADYHVALSGQDTATGSPSAPWRTIGHAAEAAQPGDTITIHAGTYRERVNPPRGGSSDSQRITYQAAPGETVEIKGSEVIKGWEKLQGDVWKVTRPNTFFGAFNPYSDLIHGDWFERKGRDHHTGAVYLNGAWLVEAARLEDLLNPTPVKVQDLKKKKVLANLAWLELRSGDGPTRRLAATSDSAHEGPQKAPCAEGGDCYGWIGAGDWIRFDPQDSGPSSLAFRVAALEPGTELEIRRENPDGELLGSAVIPATGDWQAWQTIEAKLAKPLEAHQKLCLRFVRQNIEGALDGQFWFGQVEGDHTTLWAQFPGVDPNAGNVEINVRKMLFYPEKTGRNFLTLRGLTFRHAATNWAPPTAEQIGAVGTNWSKGWIIENNTVSHSVCAGIALGKHGDEFDNKSADTAKGYVATIDRAIAAGWNKETIGHHMVRNNHIYCCEQTGIVGSLGAVFSTITGNEIHDIHVRHLFGGAEMAGIKIHAAIDTQISHNHIYRTCLGLWLDWMAQGTRVSGNLFHNNGADIFAEVNHGPLLIDNNCLLSGASMVSYSRGVALVHNLITGRFVPNTFDPRSTPYHLPHQTTLAGMSQNAMGDDRHINNIYVGKTDLGNYKNSHADLPVRFEGSAYLAGAKPAPQDATTPLAIDPGIKLVEKTDGYYLQMAVDKAWATQPPRNLVTTARLGQTLVSKAHFEQPDGSPLTIDTDYLGHRRDAGNPMVGPLELPESGAVDIKLWAK